MFDAQKIRTALQERNLTQKQLAKRLAIQASKLSEYLKGRRRPPGSNFQARVEQALAVPSGTFTLSAGAGQ